MIRRPHDCHVPTSFCTHSKADYILGNVWQNRTWRLGMAVPGVTKWMATLVQQVFFATVYVFLKTFVKIGCLYQNYIRHIYILCVVISNLN